ncbi:MAG TPA: hypothetical protein VMV46_07780 [Thermoanaerobaculia bacterium]|nr:hypothetical protein [Thermoanaerobaculia bacterium]
MTAHAIDTRPSRSALQPLRALLLGLWWTGSLLAAQVRQPEAVEPALRQTSADAYTRYELLEPSTRSFRIVYDVTATTPGARWYFNPIRPGSEPTVHSVADLFTGEPLEWRLVDGDGARARGLAGASPGGQYIEVTLTRPVPAQGEGRIRIDKTYRDPESYRQDLDRITFERSLGVERNAVVLPAGYELIECNAPVQVASEEDGRIKVSFVNRNPAPMPLRLVGRRLPQPASTMRPEAEVRADAGAGASAPPGEIEDRPPVSRLEPASARRDWTFSERAFQDREIVYFLQQPETHSFRLYHDYTETRSGMDRYLNVVRPGSRASEPSAHVLDTGEKLEVETLRGAAITEKGIELDESVTADTEVVAIWFDPVRPGSSVRLRIEETYTDPGRYGLDGEELLWDRSFGRPRNTVVLPEGWRLTASSIPAVVDLDEQGRVRLVFVNDRPDEIDVLIRARRR